MSQQNDSHLWLTSPAWGLISKKCFYPGGMAPSEWTRSVRAVGDTPLADYSAPGVNTTSRVANRPPIAVLPFLLTVSVSYFKQTLWRCGQLWPYVRMGSFGTRLHRDCNGWHCENLSSRSIYVKLEVRWTVRRYDTTQPWGSMQLHGSTKSRTEQVRPKVGKARVWISLYDKRRWKWDDVYLLRGLPNIYSPSLCPPPLPLYIHTTAVAPWRCTWSRVFERNLETQIEWTQRCTWRPWLSEFGYALGDCDRASLEMDLEAMIVRTCRP